MLAQLVAIALVAISLAHQVRGRTRLTRPAIIGGKRMHMSVVYGPMFSGKTKTMIDMIVGCGDPKRLVFKHARDSRTQSTLSSHDGACNDKIEAMPIRSAYQILEYVEPDTKWIFVDEIQFFESAQLAKVLDVLAQKYPDIHLVFAGLDLNWKGERFQTTGFLLNVAGADELITCKGVCACCGGSSTHSYLIEHDAISDVEVIGGAGTYEPRCGDCYALGMRREIAS